MKSRSRRRRKWHVRSPRAGSPYLCAWQGRRDGRSRKYPGVGEILPSSMPVAASVASQWRGCACHTPFAMCRGRWRLPMTVRRRRRLTRRVAQRGNAGAAGMSRVPACSPHRNPARREAAPGETGRAPAVHPGKGRAGFGDIRYETETPLQCFQHFDASLLIAIRALGAFL